MSVFARKVSLSGKLKFLLLAFVVWLGGCGGMRYAGSQMTPYSVAVSGYTRGNGTHVSSYHRRPAGGKAHDAPYEGLSAFCALVCLSALIAFGVTAHNIITLDPLDALPKGDLSPPVEPKVKFRDPWQIAVGRQAWRCSRCSGAIGRGEKYLYYPTHSGGRSDRARFCFGCRDALRAEANAHDVALQEYQSELAKYRLALAARFEQVYGVAPARLDSAGL